jgi:mRNA-degrading endonuclease RelE of RelBE toxin-antitoxin system
LSRYKVVFLPEVIERDFPEIPKNIQKRIFAAIDHRLTTAPDQYGMRLHQSLTGLWRLRVGDYRVAYEILETTVRVWAVVYRKEAYEKIAKHWARKSEGT